MTQTFEEYVKDTQLYKIFCLECNTFLCYSEIADDDVIHSICPSCMRKYYDENKK